VSHPSSGTGADNTLRIRALNYCNGRMRGQKKEMKEREKGK